MNMTDVDSQIARSSELINRVSDDYRQGRGKKRRINEAATRVKRVVIADTAIILAAILWGALLNPIGMGGFLIVLFALIVATLLFALLPAEGAPEPEKLAQVDLKALPRQTERWLDSQRPLLPAPAVRLADDIGVKLDMLAPQLATLKGNEPAAAEVRRLVGEQLPELIKGYHRVPQSLRTSTRNGKSPDAQLVDGLKLIDEEIAEMTAKLAEGDMNLLATRSRYLEIAYRDERGLD
jgi:hypothetical protein